MADITTFYKDILYPSLFSRVDSVFPSMEFKFVRGKWISPKNIDGTTPENPRRDKTVITQNQIWRALENGEGGAKDLLTLYMHLNNISNNVEAAKQICSIIGIDFPEDREGEEKWKAYKERQDKLASSHDRQKKALFSPEGAEVLRYLTEERGYSLETIKAMELGFISKKEKETLKSIGIVFSTDPDNDFNLSIPYDSNGKLLGFTLRYTSLKAFQKYGSNKYRYVTGLTRTENPCGLPPLYLPTMVTEKEKRAVIVEGVLESRRVQKGEGIPYVIATGGGALPTGTVAALQKRGFREIVLILDNDEPGQKYTEKSVKELLKARLLPYVATLPDGVKDIDEYLKNHSREELLELISTAIYGEIYLYTKIEEKYQVEEKTPINMDRALEEFYNLVTDTPDDIKKERLYEMYEFSHGLSRKELLQAIKREGRRRETLKESQKAHKKAEEGLQKANTLLKEGKPTEAEKETQKALRELQKAEGEDGYSFLLEDNTEALWESYRTKPKTLKTNFELSYGGGANITNYSLSFPSGAISVIGAPTNHGKSKVLQTFALDAALQREKGTILYLTYEENEENVNKQFLNAYANIELTKPSAKGGNLQTITDYLFNGSTKFMRNKEGQIAKFKKAEEEWKAIRKTQRIKIVKPGDNFLKTLLGLLRYAVEHLQIRAVFLDYIQELYIEGYRYNGGRTDEIKEIMVELDLIAQEYNIPIIMAAQLGRTVEDPLDLNNQKLSDSGWIERKASEILLMWSNKELPTGKKSVHDIEEEGSLSSLELGKGGKLFFKLTKSRFIPTGSRAIVEINGNTGRVKGNATKIHITQEDSIQTEIKAFKAPEKTPEEIIEELLSRYDEEGGTVHQAEPEGTLPPLLSPNSEDNNNLPFAPEEEGGELPF